MNVVIALVSVIVPYFLVQSKGAKRRDIGMEVCKGFLLTVASLLAGLGLCYVAAVEIDFFDYALFWFNRTYLSIAIYSSLSLAVYSLFYARFFGESANSLSLGQKTQARLLGVNIFWSLITLGLTSFGYRSAYIVMYLNLIYLVSCIAIAIFRANKTSKKISLF